MILHEGKLYANEFDLLRHDPAAFQRYMDRQANKALADAIRKLKAKEEAKR